MGFFEISSLAAAVFNTGLALLVVRRDLRSLLHRAYIGWAVSLTIWNVAAPVLATQTTIEGGMYWARILQLGVIFMPICLLHVCLILTSSRRGRAIPFLYATHAVIALSLPVLVGGAVVTESIFAWPGMGRLFYNGLQQFDFALLMGYLMLTSLLVVFFNLIADIAYAWLDPRVKYS